MIKIYDQAPDGTIIDSNIDLMNFYGGEVHARNVKNSNPVAVQVNGANSDELIAAAMIADVAHAKGNAFTLLLPYLPAARADKGTPFGAKIYANIINSMNAEKVVILDPHSNVMPELINNVHILPIRPIIEMYLKRYQTEYTAVISPDLGSRKRSGAIAEALGVPLVLANKNRDSESGNLVELECEPLPDVNGRYLAVDDIADGGDTLVKVAEAINIPKNQLHLFVTHGVFAPSSSQLTKYYEEIVTTNSHPGCYNPNVNATVIDIDNFLINEILTRNSDNINTPVLVLN